MAVKMIRDIESKEHTLKTVLMDDDNSTICKVGEKIQKLKNAVIEIIHSKNSQTTFSIFKKRITEGFLSQRQQLTSKSV